MKFDYSVFDYSELMTFYMLAIGSFLCVAFGILQLLIIETYVSKKKLNFGLFLPMILIGNLAFFSFVVYDKSAEFSELREVDYRELIENIEESYGITEIEFSNSVLWTKKRSDEEFISDPLTMNYTVDGVEYLDNIVFRVSDTEEGRFLKIFSGNDKLREFIPQSGKSQ